MTEKKFSVKTLTLIGLMAALLCVLGPLSIPLPITLVPISLTNLVIYIILYVLGTKRGTVSYLIYFLLGLVGLPVFSGFSGGIGKVAGPTGGYLVGFLFICLIAGPVIGKFHESKPVHMVVAFAGMFIATAICYAFGTVWFSVQQQTTFSAALAMCVLPFIPGDLIKIVAAMLIGPVLHKRLHRFVEE